MIRFLRRLHCAIRKHRWVCADPTPEENARHLALYYPWSAYEPRWDRDHRDRVCSRCHAVDLRLQRKLGRTDEQRYALEILNARRDL